MTICERIFKTIEEKGKTPAQLCRVLKVGTGQTTAWKRRNVDPPPKYLAQIADFLDVSLDFLIRGDDSDCPRLTTVEKEIVTLLRQLPIERVYEFKGELRGYMHADSPREDDKAG